MVKNVTMNMIYDELLKIKKELIIVEHAVIPTESLSKKEIEEHKKDLKDALEGKRISFGYLKKRN